MTNKRKLTDAEFIEKVKSLGIKTGKPKSPGKGGCVICGKHHTHTHYMAGVLKVEVKRKSATAQGQSFAE